jgi:hypothetical protein
MCLEINALAGVQSTLIQSLRSTHIQSLTIVLTAVPVHDVNVKIHLWVIGCRFGIGLNCLKIGLGVLFISVTMGNFMNA